MKLKTKHLFLGIFAILISFRVLAQGATPTIASNEKYENRKQGFAINFPVGWEIREDSNGKVEAYQPGEQKYFLNPSIAINTIAGWTQNISSADFYGRYDNILAESSTGAKYIKTEVKIDGRDGYKIVPENENGENHEIQYIVFDESKKVGYLIQIFGEKSKVKDINKIDQHALSFKFL